MQHWRHVLILWVIIFLSCSAEARTRFHLHSQPVYGTQNLIAEINRIVAASDPNATVGIYVKSMKYGDTLYAKNTQRLLIPASIMKIFTAEAALLYLGPQFKFPTRFFTDAQPFETTNGVLNGNLYFVHSGDPSLTYFDIANLMSNLKAGQISRINGNVYIDNSAYDQNNFGPGWIGNDTRYCYAAPINASIINHNCLNFKIAPANRPGYLANIVPNNHYYYGNIVNYVTTRSSRTRACYLRLGRDANEIITISGCVPKGHFSQGVSVVVANVIQYNESMLRSLFHQFGIMIKGSIAPGVKPGHSAILATHESPPLPVLVTDMLKKSDNIIAGSLFKKIGELYTARPGSWENGSFAVKQILARRAALDISQINIADGAGLSEENRIKPAQMMQVLEFAYHNTATNSAFVSALPIAGKDGTLKHRLYNVTRKVRAKTGTLAGHGVVSLAGYAVSKNKETIGFVIIVNGRRGNDWKYRAMEDQIVTALTNYVRT